MLKDDLAAAGLDVPAEIARLLKQRDLSMSDQRRLAELRALLPFIEPKATDGDGGAPVDGVVLEIPTDGSSE